MKKLTLSTLKSKAFLAGSLATISFAVIIGLLLGQLKNGNHFTITGYVATIAAFLSWIIISPVTRILAKRSWSMRRKLVHGLSLLGFVIISLYVFQDTIMVSPYLLYGMLICLLTLDTATEFITEERS